MGAVGVLYAMYESARFTVMGHHCFALFKVIQDLTDEENDI